MPRIVIREYEILSQAVLDKLPAWHARAYVRCPSCHGVMSISPKIHKILDNGDLTPSLVCRFDSCRFHAFVTLENYPHNSIEDLIKQPPLIEK